MKKPLSSIPPGQALATAPTKIGQKWSYMTLEAKSGSPPPRLLYSLGMHVPGAFPTPQEAMERTAVERNSLRSVVAAQLPADKE